MLNHCLNEYHWKYYSLLKNLTNHFSLKPNQIFFQTILLLIVLKKTATSFMFEVIYYLLHYLSTCENRFRQINGRISLYVGWNNLILPVHLVNNWIQNVFALNWSNVAVVIYLTIIYKILYHSILSSSIITEIHQ